MLKKLLIPVLLIWSSILYAQQTYQPSMGTVINKPMGDNGFPLSMRNAYYDVNKFVFRPFVSTAEVLSYFNTSTKREWTTSIIINTGGVVGLNGKLTGGTNSEWWFKDGVADANLMIKSNDLANLSNDTRIRMGPNATGVGKISVNGEYTEMNKHTFDDYSTIISSQTGLGYASYDASAYLIGSTVNDHFAAFQGRMKYGGSGGINGNLGITSFYSRPEHTGTGLLQNHQGVLIEDIAGNGPVQNSTGILVLPITRGNQNYSIYTNAGRVHLGDKLDVLGDVVSTGPTAVFGLEDQDNQGQFWTTQVNNGVLNIGSVNEQKIHMSISKFGNVSVNGLFFANTATNTFGIATGNATGTNLKFTGTGGTSVNRPAIQAFKNGSDPNQLLTLQEGGGTLAIGKTTDDGSGALVQLAGRANGSAAVNATDFVIKQQVKVLDSTGDNVWPRRIITANGNAIELSDNNTDWYWIHTDTTGARVSTPATVTVAGGGPVTAASNVTVTQTSGGAAL